MQTCSEWSVALNVTSVFARLSAFRCGVVLVVVVVVVVVEKRTYGFASFPRQSVKRGEHKSKYIFAANVILSPERRAAELR